MSGQQRPCQRDDLVAIVPQLSYWRVQDDGETGDFRTDGEFTGIEQYGCFNCGKWFAPEDADSPNDWDRAWQDALEHLPRPDAPKVAAMCRCLPSVSRSASLKGDTK